MSLYSWIISISGVVGWWLIAIVWPKKASERKHPHKWFTAVAYVLAIICTASLLDDLTDALIR